MRVLLVNAFHWLKGGVERTYFDESRWLSAAGHEVAHFATRDERNLPSPTAEYFAPAADYGAEGAGLSQLSQLPRALWSAPAARAMERLVGAFHPDVAHVHAPSRYLTPSVLRPLERAGVPIVHTLHDFKPWCTNRLLFAHGAPCDLCHGGAHWHAAAISCVQDSRGKSVIGSVEAYLHDAVGAYRAVRLWLAPSKFARDVALAHGLKDRAVRVLTHGVDAPAALPARAEGLPERYVLFLARLSAEKGVKTLPAIAGRIAPVPLVVAGDGPLASWLAGQRVPNLIMLGHLGPDRLPGLRAHAAVVISPSLFHETFGYSVAEALLDARPVVASRIGALPELVEHEVTGLLAPPGDDVAHAEATQRALTDPAAARWGAAGRDRVRKASDVGTHVRGLLSIYEEARRG